MSPVDLQSLAPELVLTSVGILILLLDAFVPSARRLATPLAVLGTLIAAWCALGMSYGLTFQGQLEASGITLVFSIIVLVATGLTLISSEGFLERHKMPSGEYQALLLWCATGILLMLRAQELLTIFVCLELFSICLYALAAFQRQISWSSEAAIKYFLMGAFVSAFLLMGLALLYGETASTNLAEITQTIGSGVGSPTVLTLGLLLLVAAFGFKMSLVPFHAWAPDTYQGSPSPFVGFLSIAPKAASALVMLRLLQIVIDSGVGPKWSTLVGFLAAASMIVGNLLALVQQDIKRMLAYSGVAHMGYLAIALSAPTPTAWTPIAVYLLAYALMNAGAFAIVAMVYRQSGETHSISDLAGLGYKNPVLGACLAISMLSLGGIPPTFGFIGKYTVFLHAVQNGKIALAILGVITSLVGAYYYLRVVYTLYMKESTREVTPAADSWGLTAAGLAAAATLALGVWPWGLLRWMLDAVNRLS